MKNALKLMTMALSLFLITTGFTPFETEGTTKTDPSTEVKKPKPVKSGKIKFVARWAGLNGGCNCPNCKCSGCPCPLGMCTCEGIDMYGDETLASDQGTATATLFDDGTITFSYDQTTATTVNGINYPVVPVSGTLSFTSTAAQFFGYSAISVPNGFYGADFTNNQYGEITVTPNLVP